MISLAQICRDVQGISCLSKIKDVKVLVETWKMVCPKGMYKSNTQSFRIMPKVVHSSVSLIECL